MSSRAKCYVVIEFTRLDGYESKEVKVVFANEGEAEQCADRWGKEAHKDGDTSTTYWVEEVNYYA